MLVLEKIRPLRGPPVLIRQTDQTATAPAGEKLDYNLIVHKPRPRIGRMAMGPPILMQQTDFLVELVPTEDNTVAWPYRRVIAAKLMRIAETIRIARRKR